ncbi:MAG: N-acetylmuramoyl-L-alanine amidase [Nannocystis sp.]|uniref:golvesin C-terminal-like domain-containing protein n=1 Tax=Nannocystis sp. TaxID=1962667 RepID=UPI0024229D39|nr:N-acetylmuramoyl-L-alanine amidase [Nannocystis sp.]MBK9752097.1 N-acetylmuramoyl-L-alanine amidase [Nannocystis sp.]
MLRLRPLYVLSGLALLALGCEGGSNGRDEDDNGGGDGIDIPDPEDPPPQDAGDYLKGIDAEFMAAAAEFDVPPEILKAVGYTESQWQMVEGQEEFEGYAPAFGTMALRGANVSDAASLLGVDEDTVRVHRPTNIRAAAALLDQKAKAEKIDRADLGAWAPSIATLSGISDHNAAISYIHNDVYGLIKNGLVVMDNDGNVISSIEPEPDVTPNYDPPGGPTLATNPDYKGAIFRASPNFSTRPASASGKVKMVIIHSCEGAYSGCWGWLVQKKAGVSAHYVVKEDGSEISQLVQEAKKAWHIAATYKASLNGGKEASLEGTSGNNFTVGIEHAGFAKQNAWNPNLIDQSAKLVCDITKRNAIPRDKYHIVGHGQLQPYNRIDPGPNWPWATFMQKIDAACGAPMPDPNPDPNPEPNPVPMDTGSESTGDTGSDTGMDPPDPPPPDPTLIVDSSAGNNDPALAKFTVSANWSATAATPGFYGNNYYFAATESISDGAEFSFYLNNAGSKKVEVWYTAGGNRSASTPIVSFDAGGANLGTANVNMQVGGKAWTTVGTYNFTKGWNKVVVSRWTTKGFVVIADAIRITADGMQQPPADPTVADLVALTQNCTPVAGTSKFKTDASANSATVQLCQLNGAIFWKADADIDCDGAADPKCTVDPDYMSTTSATDSNGKYINSAKVPFYVVPLASNGFVPKDHGIKTGAHYGSAGAIIYNGKVIYAPYADAGPSGVIGELSYAAAEQLGIPPSPINGGVASGVTYIVFTGANYIDPIENTTTAATLGKSLASKLIADNK